MAYTENENMRELLRSSLPDKTFQHCLRTREYAMLLANRFGADTEVCQVAALLHDCAKNIKIVPEEYKVFLVDFMDFPKVVHAPLGALLAKEKYHINDERILSAIKYHTTGKAEMTKEEQIIYLADAAEQGRDYKGVDEIRTALESSLDKAMYLSLKGGCEYLLNANKPVHPLTIEAMHYYNRE